MTTNHPSFDVLYEMVLDAASDAYAAVRACYAAPPEAQSALAERALAACQDAIIAIRTAKRAAPPEPCQLAAIERARAEGRMRYTDARLSKITEVR